jgi:hypothetical protein
MKKLIVVFTVFLALSLTGCFHRSCPTYVGTGTVDKNNHTTRTDKDKNKFAKENRKSTTYKGDTFLAKINPKYWLNVKQ